MWLRSSTIRPQTRDGEALGFDPTKIPRPHALSLPFIVPQIRQHFNRLCRRGRAGYALAGQDAGRFEETPQGDSGRRVAQERHPFGRTRATLPSKSFGLVSTKSRPPRVLRSALGEPAPPDGFHPGGLLYVDAEGNVGQLPRDTDPETVRKMLAGQASAATASPVPSGR